MHVSSLGFRTDLALLAASGSLVEDRGTHLVVRTPDNPSYYWGNFLLLAAPPVPGGEREVVGAFHTEFPQAGHVSIGIDTADLSAESRAGFEAAGMTIDVAAVLTATGLGEPRAVQAEVRALESDADWASRARLSLAIEDRPDAESHLRFAHGRNLQEQTLVAAGRGTRFGAFVDGEVVSTAAVFTTEEGIARFQSVETHPGHRRQGLAAATVHAAGSYALEHLGARTLVIVAEDDGDAMRIYRGLGFAATERQLMMERRPDQQAGDEGR